MAVTAHLTRSSGQGKVDSAIGARQIAQAQTQRRISIAEI